MTSIRKNAMDFIAEQTEKGICEYESDIKRMSDHELWDHCFADNDIDKDDFCIKELERRFFNK